jgi:hypothetical protein
MGRIPLEERLQYYGTGKVAIGHMERAV